MHNVVVDIYTCQCIFQLNTAPARPCAACEGIVVNFNVCAVVYPDTRIGLNLNITVIHSGIPGAGQERNTIVP
ncbi:hypothetical protein SDC9_116704 [bioreactor metagenome]|uniref:Uncharacterized protein n=1 Tax=bioreactor metagenome TaxID=1076179 RepID=A0A645BW63_9ZZZZ